MTRSGDREIAAIARDRGIGEPEEHLTTEARRHGEDCRNDGFSDHPITRDHPIARSLIKLLRNVTLIATATLREIFDESAYDRFLARTQTLRSVESYREFMRERETTVAKRPRCC